MNEIKLCIGSSILGLLYVSLLCLANEFFYILSLFKSTVWEKNEGSRNKKLLRNQL